MIMKKKITTDQEGAALLEFAIIMPLFFALIFGIIEFSLLLYNKQIMTNAAREGARLGIIVKSPRVPVSEIRTEIKKYAQNHLVTFGSDTLQDEDINIVRDGSTFGDELRITVDYDYQYLFFSNSTIPIKATSTMRME